MGMNAGHANAPSQQKPKGGLEVSGDSEYLQGQKLPGVFKHQSKHLDKVSDDKKRLKDYYSNV